MGGSMPQGSQVVAPTPMGSEMFSSWNQDNTARRGQAYNPELLPARPPPGATHFTLLAGAQAATHRHLEDILSVSLTGGASGDGWSHKRMLGGISVSHPGSGHCVSPLSCL